MHCHHKPNPGACWVSVSLLGLCVFSVFSDEAIRNLSDVNCFGAAGGGGGDLRHRRAGQIIV